MIESLMLFGSAARGDIDVNSDIDILAVSDGSRPSSHKVGGIEIQFMSSAQLIKMANSGDLFALHLAREGKIIFDFSGHLARLKSCAVPKKSYTKERQWAFDLAWFLLDFGEGYEPTLVNKRIAWCVRTIVISLLAELGEIAFSPAVLSDRFPGHEVPYLIGLRRSGLTSDDRMKRLKEFLVGYKAERPNASSPSEFLVHFGETQNKVAIGTFHKLVAGEGGNEGAYP